MQGKIVISSAFELKQIENQIFNVIMEDGCHVHVVLENHNCNGGGDTYNIFSSNMHPSIKCLLVHNKIMPEMKALDAVLRINNIEGFFFCCPNCPVGSPP